ncbi:hypothetical protein JW756_03805 [Candidatus Woesearchaeota archaeon]|nr:hypothetical protein [Candidatus Woesearchaeota archaeon]
MYKRHDNDEEYVIKPKDLMADLITDAMRERNKQERQEKHFQKIAEKVERDKKELSDIAKEAREMRQKAEWAEQRAVRDRYPGARHNWLGAAYFYGKQADILDQHYFKRAKELDEEDI